MTDQLDNIEGLALDWIVVEEIGECFLNTTNILDISVNYLEEFVVCEDFEPYEPYIKEFEDFEYYKTEDD